MWELLETLCSGMSREVLLIVISLFVGSNLGIFIMCALRLKDSPDEDE